MAFFQTSVVNKYLNSQDKDAVKQAFGKFSEYFHNPDIQKNIRSGKETQFQSKFLMELFVKVFGYTLFPDTNHNLIPEFKNEQNANRADGAILRNGKTTAVIELKGTNTTDLKKVEAQAFGYKNNHTDCVYVITSNYEKLWFYINDALDPIEFNLFTLTEERFKLLWFCLNKASLLSGTPEKAKKESLVADENVTKQLYKDYSEFKNALWLNMIKNSPDADQLLLYKKTQKLLDRFLFIFFSEDSGLLPPNSISSMVERWRILQEQDAYKPLYDIFKQFFSYINTGKKGKTSQDDIFAYNGGLFLPDDILENIIIDDDVIHPHVMRLTAYNFESEVNVNILGHIFENSLNEIENVRARLEGKVVDKKKTKRKKDGVFYTPKYITKYIVDNTVGKLCEEKKVELGIDESEYAKGSAGRQTQTRQKLLNKLNNYRDWLKTITICDPACGSGAFLNQALEFLIAEHAYTDELEAKLFDGSIVFKYVTDQILENNLFGVDINEESVEIAKLSLWLRTAEKGRKLTSLNNNIKCGNSLIDDPEVAGELAFNWEKEFPDIFAKGGFDVVIGNPPYVSIQGIKWDDRRYYETIYQTATGRFDLYTLFIERAMQLKKLKGSFSFIVPGKILNNKQFKQARKIVCENHSVEILKIADKVFDEAAVDSVILLNHVSCNSTVAIYRAKNLNISGSALICETTTENILNNEGHIFRLEINNDSDILIKKIEKNTVKLKEIAEVKDGIVAGTIKDILFLNKKADDACKKLYFGKHLSRYYMGDTNIFVNYKPDEMMTEEIKRKGNKRPGLWMRNSKIFLREKILTRFVGKEIIAYYDNSNKYYEHTLHSTHVFDDKVAHKYILGLFNSKLIKFYYQKTNSQGGNIFPQIRISSIENLPIKLVDYYLQEEIIASVNIMIVLNEQLHENKIKFLKRVTGNLEIEKTSKKLQFFYSYDFRTFIAELKKQKVKLSLTQQDEWEEYFTKYKNDINKLQFEISATDRGIDQMVYKLYDLTEEEIKIIESE